MPIYGLDLLNSVQIEPECQEKEMVNFDSVHLKSQIMGFKFDGSLPVAAEDKDDNRTVKSFSVFRKKMDVRDPLGSVSALFLGSMKDSVSQACPTESNHGGGIDHSIREIKRPSLKGPEALRRGSVDSMYTMVQHLNGQPGHPTVLNQVASNFAGIDKLEIRMNTRRRSIGVAMGSFVNSEIVSEGSIIDHGSRMTPANSFGSDRGRHSLPRVSLASRFRTSEPAILDER